MRAKLCILMTLLLLTSAVLSGCVAASDYPPELTLRDMQPPQKREGVDPEPVEPFEADLYFLSEEQRTFRVEQREVLYGGNVSRAEAAVRALMDGPENENARRSVPSWIALDRVELCVDVCNVFLRGQLQYIPDANSWLILRAAIAATVIAAEGVETVNVYFHELERGYLGYPLGGMGMLEEELSIYLRNLERTFSALKRAGNGVNPADDDIQYITQPATLYFTNNGGTLLAARGVDVTYAEGSTKSDIARVIVDQLKLGDTVNGALEPVLPADFRLLAAPVVIYNNYLEDGTLDTEGDCTIRLFIERPTAVNYNEKLMCGALTMSLTGFIPNVGGVEVCIGKADGPFTVAPDTSYNKPNEADAVPDGIEFVEMVGGKTFRHVDFTDLLGYEITVYYPDEDGFTLHGVSRIIPEAKMYDPMARLQEMFGGYAAPGVAYPLFTAEDIKEAYVVDGVAVVDWEEGFSEKLRAFINGDYTMEPSRRESIFVYGVVNTLTEMPMITSVWILENGKKIAKVENIYLGNALLRNPGVIVEE